MPPKDPTDPTDRRWVAACAVLCVWVVARGATAQALDCANNLVTPHTCGDVNPHLGLFGGSPGPFEVCDSSGPIHVPVISYVLPPELRVPGRFGETVFFVWDNPAYLPLEPSTDFKDHLCTLENNNQVLPTELVISGYNLFIGNLPCNTQELFDFQLTDAAGCAAGFPETPNLPAQLDPTCTATDELPVGTFRATNAGRPMCGVLNALLATCTLAGSPSFTWSNGATCCYGAELTYYNYWLRPVVVPFFATCNGDAFPGILQRRMPIDEGGFQIPSDGGTAPKRPENSQCAIRERLGDPGVPTETKRQLVLGYTNGFHCKCKTGFGGDNCRCDRAAACTFNGLCRGWESRLKTMIRQVPSSSQCDWFDSSFPDPDGDVVTCPSVLQMISTPPSIVNDSRSLDEFVLPESNCGQFGCVECDCANAPDGLIGRNCCPYNRIGDDCLIETLDECAKIQEEPCSGNGQLLSGPGNNKPFPDRLESTGCLVQNSGGGDVAVECNECAPPFWRGQYCRIDEALWCGVSTCSGRGTCVVEPRDPNEQGRCDCEPGYRGVFCQFPITQCTHDVLTGIDNPCAGHGVCLDLVQNSTRVPSVWPDTFGDLTRCVCDEGWGGRYCHLRLDKCNSGPVPAPDGTPSCADRGVCETPVECSQGRGFDPNTQTCLDPSESLLPDPFQGGVVPLPEPVNIFRRFNRPDSVMNFRELTCMAQTIADNSSLPDVMVMSWLHNRCHLSPDGVLRAFFVNLRALNLLQPCPVDTVDGYAGQDDAGGFQPDEVNSASILRVYFIKGVNVFSTDFNLFAGTVVERLCFDHTQLDRGESPGNLGIPNFVLRRQLMNHYLRTDVPVEENRALSASGALAERVQACAAIALVYLFPFYAPSSTGDFCWFSIQSQNPFPTFDYVDDIESLSSEAFFRVFTL